MTFEISKSVAQDAFNATSKVLSPKNSMPILDCFKLSVHDNVLGVTASDGEKYLTINCPLLSSDGDFTFCANAKSLTDGIRNIGEQPIRFEIVDGCLSVSHMNGTFKTMVGDHELYPQRAMLEEYETIELDSDILLDAINHTLYATANDEIRLVMTGICLDSKESALVFASTDGRKLVKCNYPSTHVVSRYILPKKVCQVLRAVLANGRKITMMVGDESVVMTSGDLTFSFRMIEGNFPNYDAVIPNGWGGEAIVDRMSLIGALKRTSVFCNQSSNLIAFDTNDGKLTISGKDLDFSTSAEENLDAHIDGDPITIGLNNEYLLEIVSSFTCENVTFRYTNPMRPILVSPTEVDNITALLMPMQL